jgi:hypothetical protein
MPGEARRSESMPPPRAAETPGFADVCFGYEKYGFRCVRRAGEAPAATKRATEQAKSRLAMIHVNR